MLDSKFNGKFTQILKIKSMVYKTNSNVFTITFLYPQTIQSFPEKDKALLYDFLKNYLKIQAKLEIKYQKSYLDEESVLIEVKKYLKKYHSSIFNIIDSNGIKVNISDNGTNLIISIPEYIYNSINIKVIQNNIVEYLKNIFFTSIFCNFISGEDIDDKNFDKNNQKKIDKKLAEIKPTPRYKVFNLVKISGKTIPPEPEFITNIKSTKLSVILAGKVENLSKKTYKRKNRNKEVEKIYYKFTLRDDNRYLNMIFFCPKVNENKMDKVVDGDSVIVIADIKKENGYLSGYIKSISFCEINTKIKNHFREKITTYKTIFPERFEKITQTNLFNLETKFNQEILDNTYVVFDIETTGLDVETCEIIEIGAVKIVSGKIIQKFQTLVKPKKLIPTYLTENVHGISNQMVQDCPRIESVIKDFFLFCKNAILVGYNVAFDMKFIQNVARNVGINFENKVEDVMVLAKQKIVSKNYKLSTIVKKLNITLDNAHRALFDALATAEVMLHLSQSEE